MINAFVLHGEKTIRLHGLRGSADMFHLAARGKPAVVVTASVKQIPELADRFATFRPGARIHALPPLDGSPYSFTSIHPSTRRARLLALDAVLKGDWDLVITTPPVFLEPLPPPACLIQPQIHCKVGECYDLSELARTLATMGYLAVDLVAQPGDFAKRGGILDIYSFADDMAYRLDFFDDELEEIRIIDPATQRGAKQVDEITVLPMFEWSITAQQAETFARKGGELWNQTGARGHFLELVGQMRDRGRFPGYLHWTTLFFDALFHFYQFMSGEVLYYVDDLDRVREEQDAFLSQLVTQGEAMSGGGQLFAPPRVLFNMEDPTQIRLPPASIVATHQVLKKGPVDEDLVTQTVPRYHNEISRFLDHWKPQSKRVAIVIVCHGSTVLGRLMDALDEDGYEVQRIALTPGVKLRPGFYLALGRLDTGFSWPDLFLTVFSERDIWSQTGKPHSRPSGKTIFHSEFRDLGLGDYVVHLDHGIGRFLGLVEMEAGGDLHEMMAIEYRNKQKLYVNLNQLDLIQRYGSSDATVQLDRMGGVTWARTKARVKKAVREMAEGLLKLYAAREVVPGLAYGPDTEWQMEFEEQFEHEPTEGQLVSAAEIKRDLGKPMDRLLVGDVGFGKTEVAMRMAFKVIMEGYQVAVLCPTTVLAFQHYHTFRNRFDGFPINIRWVSRFSRPAQIKKSLGEAAQGKVDILIGTHRMLSKDVQFKRLGALVIDEEQRFGVAHKEKLKQLRKQMDVLSMSATPIPRTLNMALTGIRDISVIESPPSNRLAISTMVAESRESLIRNAIEFELARKGQVFFIHNRVETMDSVAANLKRIVPRAEIAMAHGQLENKRIEKVMVAFMERKVDILVASTIIENGVDIPNANTMIVNRADMFGMSQLYQLRGRIGRSDRPAYAYFLVPPRARMTPLARKRLAALEEFSDLGSGFRIAAMDMELRGAGNMLGGEQAGHIHAIGYDLYVKLLEEAVSELKGKPVKDEIRCVVNLGFGAAVPRTFIEETNQRLHYYKRLAGAREPQVIDELRQTLADCFGPLPEPVENLCLEHELRLFLASRGVVQVEREASRLKLRFHESARVNAELVLSWVSAGRDVSISPEGVLSLPLESRAPQAVYAFAREMVETMVDE